ncbi:MAG: cation-efflux pump [Candidatus Thorarchaeota archaeon]|jgi:cation diffusion facilitator family transporter
MTSYGAGRDRVKRAAALSVLAALFLTLTKLIIGVWSNSIGIISESLHSGLDFVAAGITFVAVRGASKEPDIDHQFGHGKIENFAALVETIILWITCIWIIGEALRRIQFQDWAEPTIAGIVIMVMSIIVDYERSRMLYRVARKHGSQALEADALHFSTDMISSSVVLIGLGFVWLGFPIADPLAAMGVCVVIFIVSYRLARRAFDALVDRAPEGIFDEIGETCESIPGVVECKRARVRTSGPYTFMDIIITVDENTSVDDAHRISNSVEIALAKLEKHVDVMVHVEPSLEGSRLSQDFDIYNGLRDLVKLQPEVLGVHKIRIHTHEDGVHIAADLEMLPNLTLGKAHDISNHLERSLADRISNLKRVTFHLEAAGDDDRIHDVTHKHAEMVERIREIVESETLAQDCHGIVLTDDGTGLTVSLDCRLDPDMSLANSHDIAEQVEAAIKAAFSSVTQVFVHIEPR